MSSSAFVLIAFTFMPHFNTGGSGDVMRTRTPVITMQEFGTEQACESAKETIAAMIDKSNSHRAVNENPFWRFGHGYDLVCVPKG